MHKNRELINSDEYSHLLRKVEDIQCSFSNSNNLLSDILNQKIKTIDYITVLLIVRTIYLIKGLSFIESIEKAKDVLNENQFYNLLEKKTILAKIKHRDSIRAVLTDYDKENIEGS